MPTGINFGTGTLYVSALPTHNPGSDGARRAINTATGEKYRWVSGTTWEVEPGGEVTYQESVTYAQLVAKIGASELEPGLQYLISDFRSSWYHLDGGAPINSPQYGAVEPIIVTAISANKIASLAFSTVHPSDVLYYDWDAANWNTDAFYSIGGTIIPDWRGVITERVDTLRNNRATFNFRVMTFRRWGITAPAYDSGTTYNLGDVVKSGNFLFLCKQYNTTGIATSNADKWVPLLGGVNINTSKFWATSSSGIGFDIPDIDNNDVGYMQIPSDGTFQDFLSFSVENSRDMDIEGDNGSRSIAANFVSQSGVNIKSKALNCTLGSCSNVELHANVLNIYFPNCNGVIIKPESANVILGDGVSIEGKIANCIVGDFCGEIIISTSYIFLGRNSFFVQIKSGQSIDIAQAQGLITGSAFSKNRAAIIQDSSFANNCQGNAFNDIVDRCNFGNNCQFNTFNSNIQSAIIKDNFINNTANGPISDTEFGYNCEGNVIDRLVSTKIENAFVGNTGVFFIDSQVDSGFQNNIFGNMVQYFKGGAGFTGTDYSASTVIYGTFAKTFLNAEGGGKVVQYIDASNAVVITSHDA